MRSSDPFQSNHLSQATALLPLLLVLAGASPALSQTSQNARDIGRTQESHSQTSTSEREFSDLSDSDRVVAGIWGLSMDEMRRAKMLLQGPRANFSVANLSPVEALGIHARSDAERRKYAELFARASHQDVERSLAWNNAYQEAIQRLYPNEPLIDYSGAPKVAAPVGSADAMNVPRSQLINDASSFSEAPSSRVPASNRSLYGVGR